MRYEYSLPPLVHEGTSSFSPGLDPIFLIDSLFRGGGFYAILPPLTADRVGGDAVFSATMMGSAHPEIAGYLNDDPLALPYNASDFAGSGAPLFVRPPWAPLAVFSLDAEYQLAEPIPIVNYQTSSDTPSVFLVTFYVDWENSDPTGVAHITLTNGDGDVGVTLQLDAAQRGIAGSGSVFTNFVTVPSGLIAAKIRMRTLGSEWRINTSFYSDGERVASVGDFDAAGLTATEDPFFRTVSIDSDGVVIGGIQIVPTTFFDSTGVIVPDIFDFQPNASLSPSLGELVATPGIDNRIAWNVLDEIVRAEQGASWIDENGHGVFRNRDILRGVDQFGDQVLAEEYEVVAAQSLESIQWEESSEQLYGEVEVAYRPFGVDTWSNPTVWKLDQVRRVLAGRNFSIIVELETPAVGFSFTVSARANQDGSGADLSANFTVSNVRQLDATTLVFTVTNNGATGYLVNTDGSPGLSVQAEIAIVEPEQAFVRYDTGNGSRRTLPIANNPWIQVREAADSLALWLVGEVTEPMPVLPGIPIKADPRIKLGDLVRIFDPTVTELNQRALVAGVSLTRVAGRLLQLLQIRPLAEPEEKVVAINVYASNSTWFKPVGLYAVRVRVVGGGGAGGGCATTAAGQGAEGGGGGGGGYSESIILASALSASVPIVVGSGGAGVTNAAGNSGGASSFGSQVAANGGGGGSVGTAVAGPTNINSGVGGTVTAGQIQVPGKGGGFGRVEGAGSRQLRSFGGDSVMGKGARGPFSIGTAGEAGTNYGGGGSGAGNGPSSGTARAGGAGAGGVVIVEEFYSPSALNVSTEMYVPAIKTVDESVISTTALQNDDDLAFLSLQPGEYVLEAMIPWDAATAADFKWQLTFSGTLDWSRLAYASSRDSAASPPNELGGVQIGSPITLAGDGVGSVQGLTLRGGFSVNAAGDLRFQFAQGTSNATNTTVRAGANLALIKVA
jgi:hypothetical protein